MAQGEGDGRRFNEEEVRAVIGRAIERQETDRQHLVPHEEGLTLEEIQRIAAEVGVDPKYIAAAVADLDKPPEAVPHSRYLGGPVRLEMERTIPFTLTEADTVELIAALRAAFPNDRGRVETLAGTVEWHARSATGDPITFHIVPEGDHTRLHLRQEFEALAVLWHLWTSFPAIFAVIGLLAGGRPVLTLVMALVTAVWYAIARFGYSRASRRRIQKTQRLMDRLEALAAEARPPARALDPPAEEPITNRIDLSEHTEDDSSPAPSQHRGGLRDASS